MSAHELATHIKTTMLRVKASTVRDAARHLELALENGADPCEALDIIEQYADSLDPDIKSNVVPIDQGGRHE